MRLQYRYRRRKPKRRGYVRPSRAKVKTGWTLRQLAELSCVPIRTIRHYLREGVLPRPPFRGTATRYQHAHLAHLVAVRRLRTSRLSLTEIRTRLAAIGPDEIEAMAIEGLPAGPLATALGVEPVQAPNTAARNMNIGVIAPLVAPRWARIELALGLELHVRDDASPNVLALAQRLRDVCASGGLSTITAGNEHPV